MIDATKVAVWALDNVTQLVAAVQRMRTAQKAYFQTRSPEALQNAKAGEAQVDSMLDKIDQGAEGRIS